MQTRSHRSAQAVLPQDADDSDGPDLGSIVDQHGALVFSKGAVHHPGLGVPIASLDPRAVHPSNSTPSTPLRLVTASSDAARLADAPSRAVTTKLPAPPTIGTPELTAEVAELYALALLRDVPLTRFRHDGVSCDYITDVLDGLNELPWFQREADFNLRDASAALRRRVDFGRQTAFRGIAPGDDTGPYLSQFLLVGDTGVNNERAGYEGLIGQGARTVSQRVRQANAEDFLLSWDSWLAAQDGRSAPRPESYSGGERFISTGRDLATYARYESFCQTYVNAYLLMVAHHVPIDAGLPDRAAVDEARIMGLIARVAQEAMEAVRSEKSTSQQRMRPEELMGRLYRAGDLGLPDLVEMRDQLLDSQIGRRVLAHNAAAVGEPSLLLPMAYADGAPPDPATASGHAAVAGACVTVLKALFDHTAPFTAAGSGNDAFVVSDRGDSLQRVAVFDPFGSRATISVEGELNKLLANIGFGRCWAGVQYFSSYWESALLGEQVALDVIESVVSELPGPASVTVPRLDGGTTRI